MTLFQAPRGTADRLPDEQKYWRYIEAKATALARSYGFGRIDSPVFEDAGLFVRSVGEGTDIVEKEMYTFEDRGGDLVTLRPEGTAPVCRAYLEHGMHNRPQPVRMYYFCPGLPLRAAPGRPLPPAPPVRRRGAGRRQPRRRCRGY